MTKIVFYETDFRCEQQWREGDVGRGTLGHLTIFVLGASLYLSGTAM